MARTAGLFARRVLHQGIHFDDIRPPVRELPHAGRPRADPGEIEDGETGEGLGGAREGHSGNSETWLKLRPLCSGRFCPSSIADLSFAGWNSAPPLDIIPSTPQPTLPGCKWNYRVLETTN